MPAFELRIDQRLFGFVTDMLQGGCHGYIRGSTELRRSLDIDVTTPLHSELNFYNQATPDGKGDQHG